MPKKRKLKPLRPYPVQINRVLKQAIGTGFFIYNFDGLRVEVVEFTIEDETGKLLNDEGKELIWYGFENDKKKCYALVVSDVKEI